MTWQLQICNDGHSLKPEQKTSPELLEEKELTHTHADRNLEVLLIALTQGCEQANVWIRN